MIEESEKDRLEIKCMPDGYVVLDDEGEHVYSATEWDYCNNHINDCLQMDDSIDGNYTIRGFILLPIEEIRGKGIKK